VPQHRGFGVGQGVERDLAVGVAQDHRRDVRGDGAAHGQAGLGQEAGAESEAVGAVVVAGNEDHRHVLPDHDAGDGVVEQAHGLGRRDGAVVDVPGDEHGVGFLGVDQRDELVEDLGLVFEQRHAVIDAAEVPVGGMQDSQFVALDRIWKCRSATGARQGLKYRSSRPVWPLIYVQEDYVRQILARFHRAAARAPVTAIIRAGSSSPVRRGAHGAIACRP